MVIEKQKGSRKKLCEGDVFSIKIEGYGFLWGAVVRTDARIYDDYPEEFLLLYIFDVLTETCEESPSLQHCQLLIPPFLGAQSFWTQGYFGRPIEPREVRLQFATLSRHYFFESTSGKYRDEYGKVVELASDYDPQWVGVTGLTTIVGVDKSIARNLVLRSKVTD